MSYRAMFDCSRSNGTRVLRRSAGKMDFTRPDFQGYRNLHRSIGYLLIHSNHVTMGGWYTNVFTAKRPTICLSCACRSFKSLNDNIYVQPAATCSSPQGSSWTRMVVVPLPCLRRQLGIHCRMNCETWISTVPPSDATWRRFCFNNTGCIERIRGAVRLCTIKIYICITLHYISYLFQDRGRFWLTSAIFSTRRVFNPRLGIPLEFCMADRCQKIERRPYQTAETVRRKRTIVSTQ